MIGRPVAAGGRLEGRHHSPPIPAVTRLTSGSHLSSWYLRLLLQPWNDPHRDIERKLAHDPDGLLVLEADGYLAGSVMAGYDGHRGWVNCLAVDPAWQGRGVGRMLMDETEQRLLALGCPKVNLQVEPPTSTPSLSTGTLATAPTTW